jgi:hypothetical protein
MDVDTTASFYNATTTGTGNLVDSLSDSKDEADFFHPANRGDAKSLDEESERGGDNGSDGSMTRSIDERDAPEKKKKKKNKNTNKKKRISWHQRGGGEDNELDLMEKIKKVEARNARGQRNLINRMKSMGTSFKGLDVNNNGIDDFDEIKEIFEDYLLPDAKGLADILDWVTIITLIVAIVHRVMYVNLALGIHDLFLHLNDGENYNHFMEDIIDDFQELDHIVGNIRIIALFIVIIGLFQFFRYLSFDKRFAIVTDTIISSSFDLIPVLAILAVVCISYAVMGTAIYGQDLIEFADIGSSLSSLFLMILGQFEGYYDST